MASYPGAVKSFATRSAGNTIGSAHMNDVQSEITAIEQELVTSGLTNALIVNAGVQFPASQVVSTDVNRLDDYQEGDWTPTVTFGGAAVGVTYGSQSGQYVKVGRNVFFKGVIGLTAKGSSTGALRMAGLPVAETGDTNAAISVSYAGNFTGLTGVLSAIVESGTTTILFRQSSATGNDAAVTDAAVTNTMFVYVSGWYRAAS
jgi:5-carboxymethyl-2-hydroxymuconate isomerase